VSQKSFIGKNVVAFKFYYIQFFVSILIDLSC